ncbi:type II secretion system protein [Candidatus Saccharibacteria bacterium]|nr:type II secretion system protein [Candidatus Saccharibacteria bacterium]
MKKQNSRGFTIIEVVLVLAIAGLIFMMVFIALPALQRGQRDTQRKNDLSRLNTALNSYQSNNRGNLPATGNWTTGFLNRYVVTSGDTFVDPSGTDYVLQEVDAAFSIPTDFDATSPIIYITTHRTCDGEGLTSTDQGARKVAFRVKLEGSGVTCQSN